MGTTVYYTATSIDGFIADEHGSLDWLFQFAAGDDDEGPSVKIRRPQIRGLPVGKAC